jgi:hypothetical protein
MTHTAETLVVNHGVLCWASSCESCVMLSQWLWIMLCYAEPEGVIHGVLCWASGCESWCVILCRVVVNHCVVCWTEWLWIMCYTESGGCESHCAILSQWLWIRVCYPEPVVVNYVLCWANGCESCCVMLNQRVWFMVCYAEQVVVNHGVLYWAGWLWIIVWYAEPSGCESCVILSRVVVNHVVLYWASGCESVCGWFTTTSSAELAMNYNHWLSITHRDSQPLTQHSTTWFTTTRHSITHDSQPLGSAYHTMIHNHPALYNTPWFTTTCSA